MGCGSCGQRYSRRSRTAQAVPVKTRAAREAFKSRRYGYQRKEEEMPVDEKMKVTVQPQPEAGVPVPNPTQDLDPSTGLPLSVIKNGTSPDSLGDTKVPPVSVTDNKEAAYEKKEANE